MIDVWEDKWRFNGINYDYWWIYNTRVHQIYNDVWILMMLTWQSWPWRWLVDDNYDKWVMSLQFDVIVDGLMILRMHKLIIIVTC